ncbi:hypothetical protein BU16DRAFT_580080 [Lophium mytilinum]|uniref:Uncharacterized protein n=1 Tax=Lophium mytilinum TaxID=390894 RepID=A0A6A6QZ68_9PEZI|nr:hypothetical protein BU16DRAFT_580080 [Lophium mytilinum]
MRSILSMSMAAAFFMVACVSGNVVEREVEKAMVTPPPMPIAIVEAELRKRASIDPVSLEAVLLTALPLSLQLMALTNIPAVSKVLWSEFLDNNKPDWFTALPADIKSYLVRQYGPSTAWATTSAPSASSSPSSFITSTATPSSSIALPIAAPTSSSSTSASPHHGLSAGAKIGLGVGIPIAVLAIIAALLACCLLRRRRRNAAKRSSRPPTPGFIPTSTRHGHSTSQDRHPLRGGAGVASPASASTGWNRDRDSGFGTERDSGMSGGEMQHIPPPPIPYHSSNSMRGSRTSFSSLHSVPEEHPVHSGIPVVPPRSPHRRSRSGSLGPFDDASSNPQNFPAFVAGNERRRSSSGLNPAFGMNKAEEAHAATAGQHAHQLPATTHPASRGQGIYAGQQNPFGNEHSYESSSDEYVSAPESVEMRQGQGGGAYPAYGGHGYGHGNEHRAELQTPSNEWREFAEWPLRNETAGQRSAYGRPVYDRVYDGT